MKDKRKEKQAEENVELEEDEALMAKMMGFATFNTTKVKITYYCAGCYLNYINFKVHVH